MGCYTILKMSMAACLLLGAAKMAMLKHQSHADELLACRNQRFIGEVDFNPFPIGKLLRTR